MGSVIGDILPSALGVAISPVPIIAAILMLLSPRAKTTSVGFLIGWVLGIVTAVTVFTLLSSVLPAQDAGGSAPISGIIKLVLGAALLFLAVRSWRGRPKQGETAALPKWMQAIDDFTFGKSLGLAFLLAAVNPKNLMLAAAAGVTIGGATLDVGAQVVAIAVFVVLAASTVLVPVIGYLVATDAMSGPLTSLKSWLQDQNATIMTVLLLVLGVVTAGKGIAAF